VGAIVNRSPAARVLERLEQLYAIGGGPGANRPGFSPAEDEALVVAAGWMEQAGLELGRDAAGNLVGRLRGEHPELPEVWTGSHLDTVPAGGKFDGALGVVAGLEAVERLGRRERTLGVVVFRAEETGCLGSHAFVEAANSLPGWFVELHVEQGSRLEAAGAPLGVVSAVTGYARGSVVFTGVAGHAGTTPMAERDDALVKASEFVLRARDVAASIEGAVATVGRVEVEPGAVNVVPGRVTLSLDIRAPAAAALERLASALGVEVSPADYPVPMDAAVREVLSAEIAGRGLPAPELVSWAGHDAAVLASAGVASGMLFVRSLAGGASHCPEEETSPEDVALATDVLAGVLGRLASEAGGTAIGAPVSRSM
jgi:acetylornithine deacetylase/succinyl-diaminopimelate desuccinylase-like protein